MAYRIVRITDLYPTYIKLFYEKYADVNSKSYANVYADLIADSFEITTSFGKEFRKIGVNATELFSNDTILQNKWAVENGFNPNASKADLILAQLKKEKPDIVWVDTTSLLNKSWITTLRKEIPSIKLLVGHICAPYNAVIAESFNYFDIVFTCSPLTEQELKRNGVRAHLMYHSFDHSILEILNKTQNTFEETDFIFTGSLLTGFGLHKTRIEYLEKFVEQNIGIKIYGNIESSKAIVSKQILHYVIQSLTQLGLTSLIDKISFLKKYKNYADVEIANYSKALKQSVRLPVFGLNMYRALQKSKLCFNIHGDIARSAAGNIRLFEATGIGSCLVTDWKENLKDLFDIDREIVTYKSVDECVEKVKWLLANPSEREKISKAGQQCVLNYHTVEKRAKELDNLFKQKL